MIPTNPTERKAHPIYSGVLMYFPDAIAEVANASFVGNEQHHPGAPLHWDKSKSMDEADCLLRHLMQAGTRDVDGVRHTAKVAWRALALLQRELEAEQDKPKPGTIVNYCLHGMPEANCFFHAPDAFRRPKKVPSELDRVHIPMVNVAP